MDVVVRLLGREVDVVLVFVPIVVISLLGVLAVELGVRGQDIVALDKRIELLDRRVRGEPAHDASRGRHHEGEPHDVLGGGAGIRLRRDRGGAPSAPLLPLALAALGGGLGFLTLPRPFPVAGKRALIGVVLLGAEIARDLLRGALGADAREIRGVLVDGGLDLCQIRGRGEGAREPLDDAHARAALLGREADETGEGELGAVVLGGHLVGLRVEHVAAPEDDVVGRVVDEVDDLGREERLPREGLGVVVFRRHEHDEQELEVALRQVEGLREPAIVEGQGVGTVLLLEFPPEPRGRVWRHQHTAALVAAEPGGYARGQRPRTHRGREEGEYVDEGAEEGGDGAVAEVEGREDDGEEERGAACRRGLGYYPRGGIGLLPSRRPRASVGAQRR